MGDDDDGDCAHDFALVEVLADKTGARLVHRCTLCQALSYEASAADRGGLTGT